MRARLRRCRLRRREAAGVTPRMGGDARPAYAARCASVICVRANNLNGFMDSQPLAIHVTRNRPPMRPPRWCHFINPRWRCDRFSLGRAARTHPENADPQTGDGADDHRPGRPDHDLVPQVGILADGREVDPVRDGAEPVPEPFEAGRILYDLAGVRGNVDDSGSRIVELEFVEGAVRVVPACHRPLVVVDGGSAGDLPTECRVDELACVLFVDTVDGLARDGGDRDGLTAGDDAIHWTGGGHLEPKHGRQNRQPRLC